MKLFFEDASYKGSVDIVEKFCGIPVPDWGEFRDFIHLNPAPESHKTFPQCPLITCMKRLQKPSFTVHWFRLWKKFCHRGLGRTCCFCAILSINVYSTTLLFSPNEQKTKKSQIRRKPGQQSDGRLIQECLAELSPALLQRCCGSCWTFSKAPATPCSPTM